MDKEKHKDRWSQGGQIYFTGGSGWGLDCNCGQTCIGEEDTILKAIEQNKLSSDPVINEILREEKDSIAGFGKIPTRAPTRSHRMDRGGH